jgi:hypothetical protein
MKILKVRNEEQKLRAPLHEVYISLNDRKPLFEHVSYSKRGFLSYK